MNIREAKLEDLQSIVELLHQDDLGSKREQLEQSLSPQYIQAFKEIETDANNTVYVITDNENVMGTFQLTFIRNLTYTGGLRAQVEGVRVHERYRGQGVGKWLMEEVINMSRKKGAHLVQLTTDKKRPEAIEFYKGLGFTASHEGMKLHLK